MSAAGGVVKENLRVLQLQVSMLSVMVGEAMITRDDLEKKKKERPYLRRTQVGKPNVD